MMRGIISIFKLLPLLFCSSPDRHSAVPPYGEARPPHTFSFYLQHNLSEVRYSIPCGDVRGSRWHVEEVAEKAKTDYVISVTSYAFPCLKIDYQRYCNVIFNDRYKESIYYNHHMDMLENPALLENIYGHPCTLTIAAEYCQFYEGFYSGHFNSFRKLYPQYAPTPPCAIFQTDTRFSCKNKDYHRHDDNPNFILYSTYVKIPKDFGPCYNSAYIFRNWIAEIMPPYASKPSSQQFFMVNCQIAMLS